MWPRQRRLGVDDGSFDLGRGLGGLFEIAAENVFVLKFNYLDGT